jgi:prevent-host-death family protein
VQYNVHTAKTQLSKLIEAALRGEEVIIAKGNAPVVKLVPLQTKSGFKFGTMSGKLKGPMPDFLEPMSEEELALWENDK